MFVFNLCVIRLNDDEIEIGWKQKLWQKYVSSICWLVVLLAAKHKNYWTDFHKNLDGGFHTSSINFWYKSRQRDVFFHFLWPCEKKIWRIYMAGVYQWVTKGDSLTLAELRTLLGVHSGYKVPKEVKITQQEKNPLTGYRLMWQVSFLLSSTEHVTTHQIDLVTLSGVQPPD